MSDLANEPVLAKRFARSVEAQEVIKWTFVLNGFTNPTGTRNGIHQSYLYLLYKQRDPELLGLIP
jgi:hypothetical protein